MGVSPIRTAIDRNPKLKVELDKIVNEALAAFASDVGYSVDIAEAAQGILTRRARVAAKAAEFRQ